MRRLLILGPAFGALALAGAALAGQAARTRCEGAGVSVQQQIAACTAVIEDTTEPAQVRASALNNRGFQYLEQRAFEDAIRDFTAAIDLKLEHPILFLNRGNAYLEKRDLERAIADYTKVIELKNNQGYSNRAAAYILQEKYKLAIDDLTELLKRAPDHVLGLMNRGIAYDKLDRYEEAIADLDKAIALKPGDGNLYLNRGTAHAHAERYDRAIEDFDKTLAINPGDADAKHNRCRAVALRDTKPGAC